MSGHGDDDGAAAPAVRPRPAYLVTVNKSNPLARSATDVSGGFGRQQAQRDHQEASMKHRHRDNEMRDQIYACEKYTTYFNNLLRDKIRPRDKASTMLVYERMRAEAIAMDTTTYNLLLEKVVDLRDNAAFTIYDEFREEATRDDTNVRPDGTTFSLMVRACERNGDYRRAFHVYSQMKDLGVFPDVSMYNTLIGYCAPLHDEVTATFIVEEMKERGAEPDVHTYNSLMNVFADAPFDVIVGTFEDMVKRKLKPNRRTFNTIMRSCQRCGECNRVFQFFEELKREAITPDVVTYNTVILATRDRLDEVIGTGKFSNVRRNKHEREVGIEAIARLSMSLLAEMEETEVEPNTFTYNTLLGVLSRCGDKRMYELFAQMKEEEARHNNVLPAELSGAHIDLTTGNTPTFSDLETLLVRSMAHAHSNDDPTGDSIGASGVRPNRDTYATLIEGSATLGVPEEADKLYHEMVSRHIKPDRTVFVKLIDVCAVKKDQKLAQEYFDSAEAQGITPDVELYNALLSVLAECKDTKIFAVFNELKGDMKQLSVKPNRDSYNVLLKGCLRLDDVDMAMRVYAEMCDPTCVVSPDTVSYRILLDLCAQNKDVERASEFVLDMKRRNVPPTINTYSRFMNVFVQANDPAIVNVFEDIKRHGPKPNLEAYTTLLEYHFRNRKRDIIGVFEDMKHNNVDPDLHAYNVLLRYFAAVTDHAKAYQYFNEMQTVRHIKADVETYNAMMEVLTPSGDDFTARVFDEMEDKGIPPDRNTWAILLKTPPGRLALDKALERKFKARSGLGGGGALQ